MKRWQLTVLQRNTAQPAWNPLELPVCSGDRCRHYSYDAAARPMRKRDRCSLLKGEIGFYCEPTLRSMAQTLSAAELP